MYMLPVRSRAINANDSANNSSEPVNDSINPMLIGVSDGFLTRVPLYLRTFRRLKPQNTANPVISITDARAMFD